MSNTNLPRARARGTNAVRVAVVVAALALLAPAARAATWKGLEPFTSRRADVERVLGTPAEDNLAKNGTLHFKVAGGMVTVFFVTPKFVAAKKLAPELEGTVLQIVLQHEGAKDTAESLGLVKSSDYDHQSKEGIDVYFNQKEGVTYTFVHGQLKTTRFSYATEQLARIQRGK